MTSATAGTGDAPAAADRLRAAEPSRFGALLAPPARRPRETNARSSSPKHATPPPGGIFDAVDRDQRWAAPPSRSIEASLSPPIRPAVRAAAHHRLLIGAGSAGGEVRIQIAGGQLAGSEIRLITNGPHISAELLTGSERSRQTLIAAMNAVRDRLERRGLTFRMVNGRRGGAARAGARDIARDAWPFARGDRGER